MKKIQPRWAERFIEEQKLAEKRRLENQKKTGYYPLQAPAERVEEGSHAEHGNQEKEANTRVI